MAVNPSHKHFIMRDKIRLLSTRPLDEALIENAAHHNIEIDVKAFIKVEKLLSCAVAETIAQLAVQPATVAFTSMNAVEVVVDMLPKDTIIPHWKIYCMGGATFTLVKKYWLYDEIAFTATNAAALAQQIIADEVKEIAFFCGNKRREELPTLLREKGLMVNEVVVYETTETPEVVTEKYEGIMFFSPSAVSSFFSANLVTANTTLFAIGNTTATAIRQHNHSNIVVSEFPAKDQLVGKAIEYYKERQTNE